MPSGSILAVNRVDFVGGAERVLLTAGRISREHGYKVTLACPAPSTLANEALQNGIEIEPVAVDRTRASISPLRLVRQARSLAVGRKQISNLVQTLRPDIIHVHHPVAALYVIKAAQASGTPLLLHVHETLPVSVPYALLARKVYRYCTHFVGVSEKSCEMIRAFGGRPDRITRIYNGVRSGFVTEVQPTDVLQTGGPHIGIFGVIEPRKGQEYFIRAAASILRTHPEAQFWIVGPLSYENNKSYLNRLRKLASELSIDENLHFTGFRDDVPRWMAGMDAVVLASTSFESLPTVIIEAAALGRPVVATSVGGVAEILRDGETGFVVPPGNSEALASALNRVLSADGSIMGEKAKVDIRERFSQARFEVEIMKCYRALLPDAKNLR
jgi:glycosyltransferase involved in cell wall biosynthesis